MSNGKAEYTYNGFLKRVKRLEGMNDTRYVLDLTKPYNDLLAIDDQNFIWGNDLLMAEGGNSFSYLNDHLGSPIRLVGETQQDEALAYDEFGVPTVESKSLHNPFGFTGYMTDDISGLYYAQARYYGAGAGRFVSEDPILNGLNWYSYCGGNPILRIDPLGLKEVKLNEIAEQYGGIGYWTETGEYCVSFGSVGWQTYGENTIAYNGKDGNLYVDDVDFINQWGIRQSENEYNSELDVYATFTSFKNPRATSILSRYVHRLTANGNELDVEYTSVSQLPSFGTAVNPSSKYIDIQKITDGALEIYNGEFQINATGGLSFTGVFYIDVVIATLMILPVYNANLSPNDIIINIGRNATIYIIDGNTKGLKLTNYFGDFHSLLSEIIYGESCDD